MYNPMDLSGRRILVTGASSGIGRACAIMCTELGASVVLVGRDKEKLKITQEMLSQSGSHCLIPFDLANLAETKNLFDEACRHGQLSGLVHSAGVAPAAPVAYQSIAEMQTAMAVNFFSFLEMGKYFSKRKYFEAGSVVAVSSVSAVVGWKGGSLYSGTKGALSAAIRSLAVELADKGIRVNAVLPSNIETPMYDSLAKSMNSEDSLVSLIKRQPLGLGKPEDVASAVCFLLSNASRFITGSNLVVDGGYLAH